MNITTLMGFLSSTSIFILSVFLSFEDTSVLIDMRSALIVVGGTCAVSLICFPFDTISSCLRVFMRRMFGLNKIDYISLVNEIVTVSNAHRKGRRIFQQEIKNIKNDFLRDAASLIFWTEAEVTDEEFKNMLEIRARTHYRQYTQEAGIFKTLGKFPPAFGLIGTTIGMIALLQSLGQGSDGYKMIGPAMAIALVTTLYGVAISNFILIPISENLVKQTEEDQRQRQMVVEGILLIQSNKPTRYVEEHIRSFLLPRERGESGASQFNRMKNAS